MTARSRDSLPMGVVGGGILGLAIGRELTRRFAGTEVVIFEKEQELATHQTGHNSGVVHAGIYYKPGSLKANLCTRGREILREYCFEKGLPYEECGKLVVAVEEAEIGRLDRLEETATQNQVPGLRRVDRTGIVEIEPHATGLAALHSPATAITDFVAIANSYAADIESAGGQILTSAEVVGIERRTDRIVVRTATSSHEVARLVICAGLHSDRVAQPVDGHDEPRIVPFRGEYMKVVDSKRDLVRGLIYPVPDPRYPFLGVHFTTMVSGDLEVGPNAVLALKREGYSRRGMSFTDVRDTLTFPGFWRMAGANWRAGVEEVWGSISKRAYMRKASRYVPAIGPDDVVRARVGVRAQALDRDGSLVDDFRINDNDGVVSVRNAPSPAATSSLAIAEYVVDRMKAL
ncbi:MAG TPA: L-2-hydroxyglutarate oxidase [Acidimicrobiia bacterium]|nr:L-2-hydroxyglutarate oxidase [Acidimicrobiia bacterium]